MRIAEIASKVTRTSVSFPLKKSSRNRGSGVLWFLPPLHQSLNAWMEERRKESLAFNGWRVWMEKRQAVAEVAKKEKYNP